MNKTNQQMSKFRWSVHLIVNSAGFRPNVDDTLANINNNMGKIGSLLEQMCTQDAHVDKPLQGKCPMDRNRMSTLDNTDETDSETSTFRSREKRLHQQTDDEISIFAGDSADKAADLVELTNRG